MKNKTIIILQVFTAILLLSFLWAASNGLMATIKAASFTPTSIIDKLGKPAGEGLLTYLPIIARPPDIDLVITGIEVTQAIQDLDNTVPLVQGRKTLVRVYPQTTGYTPVSDVRMELDVFRGQTLITTLTTESFTVQGALARSNLDYSFNIDLPENLLQGELTLRARVDAGNGVNELNENNNELFTSIAFNSVPPLNITIVPISYTYAPTGVTCPAPASEDVYSDFVLRSYPLNSVNVSFHAPVNFVGDLTSDAEATRLLQQITDLKQMEGASASRVYYGIFPLTAGSSCPVGVGGKGWIGQRVAIGHEGSGALMAHEIGHTFGLKHAPCGGSDSSVDPSFPYTEGSIGEYGVDVFNMVLYPPTGPNYATDIMSYRCQFIWFSDYHYRKLFEDQTAKGFSQIFAPTTDVLMLRAHFDEAGNPSFKPIYVGTGQPSPPAEGSQYLIELMDETGGIRYAQPVSLTRLSSDQLAGASINANIQYSELAEITEVRLTHLGNVLARRVLNPISVPQYESLITLDETTGILSFSWTKSANPILIRYSYDDGQNWVTLGIDVVDDQLLVPLTLLSNNVDYLEISLSDTTRLTQERYYLSYNPFPLLSRYDHETYK